MGSKVNRTKRLLVIDAIKARAFAAQYDTNPAHTDGNELLPPDSVSGLFTLSTILARLFTIADPRPLCLKTCMVHWQKPVIGGSYMLDASWSDWTSHRPGFARRFAAADLYVDGQDERSLVRLSCEYLIPAI